MLNPELLKILCCPIGKADLEFKDEYFVCTRCKVKFPIKDDIPIFLRDEGILPDGIQKIEDLECQRVHK